MQEIEDVFDKVKEGFNYKRDIDRVGVVEHWGDAMGKLDEQWEGDCDDFAITCALLAEQKNISEDKIRVIFCKVETGGGHLICGIDTEDDTLILDNRQKFVVSAGELSDYEFISGMRLSEPGVWKTIN